MKILGLLVCNDINVIVILAPKLSRLSQFSTLAVHDDDVSICKVADNALVVRQRQLINILIPEDS